MEKRSSRGVPREVVGGECAGVGQLFSGRLGGSGEEVRE